MSNQLTRNQVVNATKLIISHAREIDGYSVYEDGWSDERVAREVGRQDSVNSVANCRIDIFGVDLKPSPKRGSYQWLEINLDEATKEIDRLTSIIVELKTELEKSQERVTKLIGAVGFYTEGEMENAYYKTRKGIKRHEPRGTFSSTPTRNIEEQRQDEDKYEAEDNIIPIYEALQN